MSEICRALSLGLARDLVCHGTQMENLVAIDRVALNYVVVLQGGAEKLVENAKQDFLVHDATGAVTGNLGQLVSTLLRNCCSMALATIAAPPTSR